MKLSPVSERSTYLLQNYVCFSHSPLGEGVLVTNLLCLIDPRLKPTIKNSSSHENGWRLECWKVNFLEYHDQGRLQEDFFKVLCGHIKAPKWHLKGPLATWVDDLFTFSHGSNWNKQVGRITFMVRVTSSHCLNMRELMWFPQSQLPTIIWGNYIPQRGWPSATYIYTRCKFT